MVKIEISDGRTLEIQADSMKDLKEIGENVLLHLHTQVMGFSEEVLPVDDIIVAAFVIRTMLEEHEKKDEKMDLVISDYNELATRYNELVTGFNTVIAVNKVFHNEINDLRAKAGLPSLEEEPINLDERRAEWDPEFEMPRPLRPTPQEEGATVPQEEPETDTQQ